MKVVWTLEAEQDRLDIWNYITSENPAAAIRLDTLFSEAAGQLSTHPRMGKAGEVPGTRELIPHESYRLVYEIVSDTVWVLTLIHTARLWPPTR